MKYMLLIYSNERSWTPQEWTECTVESTAVCHELSAKGQFCDASPLHPVATAVSVRVRDGQRLVTDGPFAETTEQLGGFFVIDVPSLDDAIDIAGRLPPATKGTVEIRPVIDLPGLPANKSTGSAIRGQKVMLLCYDDEQYWNQAGEAALQAAMTDAVQLTHRLDDQEKYLIAAPLHPAATATSVRVRQGKRIVTSGPFAETREILGGYYLLDVQDLQEAIPIAAQHPGVHVGTVEIRRVYELPNLPGAPDSR